MGKIYSVRDNSSVIEEKERKEMKELSEIIKYQKENDRRPIIIIEFSWKIVALVLLVLSIIFLSKQLTTVAIFLFLGFVFMSSAKPVVDWLVSKKISKGWAVFITYLVSILVILSLFSVVLVPFVSQLSELVLVIPGWINNFVDNFKGVTIASYNFDINFLDTFVKDFLKSFPTGESFKEVAAALSSIFGATTLILTSVIFSIYLVLEHDSLFDFGLVRISSDQKRARVRKLVEDVERKLGRWLLGQATVSSLAGIYGGLLLTVLNVPFALPLAVFISLLNAIPNIGATVAIIPTALVALVTQGPVSALIVLVALVLYQQLENNYISPRIMGNVVGLKPILVMIGVVTLLLLFGVMGALIAVPLMVIIKILYEFYIDLQKLKAKGIV